MIKMNAEAVIKFVSLRARVKKLVALEKSICDAIKEAMEYRKIGEFGPVASPYKLILRKAKRTDVDYEDMAMRVYKRHYGKAWRAQFDVDKEAYGESTVVSLHDEPNERYKVEAA